MKNNKLKSDLSYNVDYAYLPLVFYLISFIIILFFWNQQKAMGTFGLFFIGFVFYYDYIKSFAEIELNKFKLKLVYHPFFRPKVYDYKLSDIKQVSIYSSYKRYHRTILYVSLINNSTEIKHTLGIGVGGAKKFYKVFRDLGVLVIELEKPNVSDKIITLP